MILCVSIFLLDRIDMILQVFEPQSREGAKGFYFFIGQDQQDFTGYFFPALTGKLLLQVVYHSFYADFFDVLHFFCLPRRGASCCERQLMGDVVTF